jgi:hypothetical protein
MEEAPLLGAMPGPDDEMATELFSAERPFVPEGLALSPAVVVKSEQDELPVLGDAYLGAADPGEPLLRALSPPPGAAGQGDVPAALLGDLAGLPELRAPEDAAPPPAYSVHVLSSLLPLGAGVRVIPVRAGPSRGPESREPIPQRGPARARPRPPPLGGHAPYLQVATPLLPVALRLQVATPRGYRQL